MTCYYVQIASSLVRDILGQQVDLPNGWNLLEQWGPKGLHSEMWLVEDTSAPEEFSGHLVEVSFRVEQGVRGFSSARMVSVSDRVKRRVPWLD